MGSSGAPTLSRLGAVLSRPTPRLLVEFSIMREKLSKLQKAQQLVSHLSAKKELDSTEMSELAAAEDLVDTLSHARPKNPKPDKAVTGSRQLTAIRLPAKSPEDLVLRLEQNLGCELPVCVSNRKDVTNEVIEVVIDGELRWQLERTARSLLPAPEHFRIWLWLVDRFNDAARTRCEKPPRIALCLSELAAALGKKRDGRWYNLVDEALSRFASLVIKVGRACYVKETNSFVRQSGAFGTLCNYVSWRTDDPEEQKTLVDGIDGWVMPGPFLWESILSGYLKAVPLVAINDLRSYVAQRLYTYVHKHCKPGDSYSVSLTKMLPKIPLNCSAREAKRRLLPHHKSLVDIGFLAEEPIFTGRGLNIIVTYKRSMMSL
jgi:hypothetical protein